MRDHCDRVIAEFRERARRHVDLDFWLERSTILASALLCAALLASFHMRGFV